MCLDGAIKRALCYVNEKWYGMSDCGVVSMLCRSIDMLRAYGVEPKTLRVTPMTHKKLLSLMHDDKNGDAVVEVNGATLKIVLDSMAVKDGNYVIY